jgi:hypothetical protein
MSKQILNKIDYNYKFLNNIFTTDEEYDIVKALLVDISTIRKMSLLERSEYLLTHTSLQKFLDTDLKLKHFNEKYHGFTSSNGVIYYDDNLLVVSRKDVHNIHNSMWGKRWCLFIV